MDTFRHSRWPGRGGHGDPGPAVRQVRRDGVRILGDLLERYGTYENNGIAFSDVDEIWWLETIGGHHWIAKRVPDDAYVTMPNQLGIDSFDLDDAEGAQARPHVLRRPALLDGRVAFGPDAGR